MKNLIIEEIIKNRPFRRVKNEIDPESIIMTKGELAELLEDVSLREYMRGKKHGICQGCRKWGCTVESGDVGTYTFCQKCKRKENLREIQR